jgi:glucokinase
MSMYSASPRLLADIGGTNARLAWQASSDAPIEAIQVFPCARFPTIEAAIQHYLHQLDLDRPCQGAIAIANPVHGDWVQMTNHHWSFSIEALRQALGWQKLVVVNDFTALALALPSLSSSALRQFGGAVPVPRMAMGLLGPGTGLGVSGLVPCGQAGWLPLQGEGGHVSLAPASRREWQVIEHLADRYGHASAERVISGIGLVALYRSLCEVDGHPWDAAVEAPDITRLALAGASDVCQEALRMMCALLGSVAGNLALTLGAKGGIYIGGGIVPRLGNWLADTDFRARFEAKGRFRTYLQEIPVWVIHAHSSPALAGAAQALDHSFGEVRGG